MPRRTLPLLALLWLPLLAWANAADLPASIDGRWLVPSRNSDQPTAIIEIDSSHGLGRLLPFDTPADARCQGCSGALAGALMHGLPLLQGLHPHEGHWKGRILDPDSGRTYALQLDADGNVLRVKAKALWGLYTHKETWQRAKP